MVARRDETNGHWSKSTAAIASYVVVITTGINQGLDRVVFPVRDDPFTGKMANARFEQVIEQQEKDREYLREYSDDNRKHVLENLEKKALAIKLYVTENYLDKNTPIPPPEVVTRLNRLERLHDRHEDQIDAIRNRIGECCYNRTTEFKTLETQ